MHSNYLCCRRRVSTQTSGFLAVLFGTTGAWADPVPVSFLPAAAHELSGSEPRNAVVADFNDDAFPDVAVACSAPASEVTILFGDGVGGFFDNHVIDVGIAAWGIAAADFDGDGAMDLAVSNGSHDGTAVQIYLGNGEGRFAPAGTATAGKFPVALATADFNGDHVVDIASANNVLYGVSILIGHGDGTFAPPAHVAGQSGMMSTDIAASDFNHDGMRDLAVSHYSGVAVFLGAGDGSFTASDNVATATNGAVAVGDVNADGNMDVLSLEIYAQNVVVNLGSGDGTFRPAVRYPTGASPTDLAVADFNRDGYPEFAVTQQASNDISLRLNDWTGHFLAPVTFLVGTQPAVAVAGDWDRNAWPDLMVPYRNLGDTAFATMLRSVPSSPCPVVARQPANVNAWEGQSIELSATITGGPPSAYLWRKDGVELSDGPAPGGGTITGATTDVLTITAAGAADTGTYVLHGSNPCGSTSTSGAVVTVRVPPAMPQHWIVTNLHPAGTTASYASGVSGDTQVGHASMPVPPYNSLSRPITWTGSAASAIDLTPGNSVGGGIADVAGDRMVGWWWWPYQCYVSGHWYTCYSQQACVWSGTPPVHQNLQVSGWEYSSASDTDGAACVGTISTDDEVGNYFIRATIWSPPNYWGASLHPEGVANSGLTSLDGNDQYGWIHTPYPGPVQHAAKWSGSAASFVDMHPPGASRSSIGDAGDRQQVGAAEFGVWHAALWSGFPTTYVDLHPPGASSSGASGCKGGLQAGSAAIGIPSHAGLWRGRADSFFDLHAYLPSEFTSSTANDLDLAADGTITVVGSGYNSATTRQEALMWRSQPPPDPVTLQILAEMVGCLAGAGSTIPPQGCDGPEFSSSDVDHDGDVDLKDFAFLQNTFTG